MSKQRLSVVVTRRLPEPVEARLQELFDVELCDNDAPSDRAHMIAAMQRADVLVPTISAKIGPAELDQAPSNRVE